MTVHTSSAVAVQRVIAQLISFARRDRVARSVRSAGWSSFEALSSLSSNTRARSMMRPNLFVITIRIAPMPERRKTGATASWIAWATATSEKSSTNKCPD